jgi:multicomponent Na+:H+ antiporter subunit G
MVVALLSAGVAIELVSAGGLILLPTVYDRIHLLGTASVTGAALVGAAVVVQEGRSPLGIKAFLLVLFLWTASPLLAHATGRAARLREHSTRRSDGPAPRKNAPS